MFVISFSISSLYLLTAFVNQHRFAGNVTQSVKGHCNLTQLAGRFCKSPSLCTREVGADTQTSVLADDQQPERRWQQDREKQGGDTQMSSQLQNC